MPRRDAGFTLAETLIATAMTLLVIGAALSALNATARITDVTRIISDTNQNVEVAMSLMVRDFVQTGANVPRGGIPFPAGNGATAIKRPGPPGSNLTFLTTWSNLPALAPGQSLGPTILGVQT